MADGLGWVGFKNFGLGWVGFSKSDPRPTLSRRDTLREVVRGFNNPRVCDPNSDSITLTLIEPSDRRTSGLSPRSQISLAENGDNNKVTFFRMLLYHSNAREANINPTLKCAKFTTETAY
jgi:hypothetical protein